MKTITITIPAPSRVGGIVCGNGGDRGIVTLFYLDEMLRAEASRVVTDAVAFQLREVPA